MKSPLRHGCPAKGVGTATDCKVRNSVHSVFAALPALMVLIAIFVLSWRSFVLLAKQPMPTTPIQVYVMLGFLREGGHYYPPPHTFV